jgi:hypothetical protein
VVALVVRALVTCLWRVAMERPDTV